MAVLVAASVAVTGLALPVLPASAVPSDAPTISVTTGGSPAAAVATGAALSVTATAPVSESGQVTQTVESDWDPAAAHLDPSSIVSPDGWSREYTSDGSVWSSVLPADPTTVRGVRSAGVVASSGVTSGLQVSTATGGGAQLGSASSFAGSPGGDGWNATAAGDKVLNVWHHNGSVYNLDCHYKATGASCGTVYTRSGYQTPMASGVVYRAGKVYSIVGRNSDSTIGVLCTTVTAVPFTDCGYTVLKSGGSSYGLIGESTLVGTRLYAPVNAGAALVCFDIATATPCLSQPYSLPGLAAAPGMAIPVFAMTVNGMLFVTSTKVWCIQGASGSPCAGAWPVNAGTAYSSVIARRDASGGLVGVCKIQVADSCWDLAGATTAYPAGLATALASLPLVNFTGSSGVGSFTATRVKQYWVTNQSYPACFDWRTQALCAGFSSSTDLGALRYAIVLDADDPSCIWSNGDNAQISSFSALTGAGGCARTDPVVLIPSATVVPRMSCSEAGRIREWRDVSLQAPVGVTTSSLRLTVNDSNGEAIPGFTGLAPDGSGVVDLSSLPVGQSGTQPSFEVTAPGATDAQALAITAGVRYTSDAPQLCMTLTALQDCRTLLPGVATLPAVAVPATTIGGHAVSTVGGSSTTTPLSVDVSRAPLTGCSYPALVAPAPATTTGQGTAIQTTVFAVPTAGSLGVLAGGVPTTLHSVPGVGTYAVDVPTGTISFVPVPGFLGTAPPVQVRVSDGFGQTADTSYGATVTLPAPPTLPTPASTGTGAAEQRAVVSKPEGGSVVLLSGGLPVLVVEVPGEGTYTLDPTTGAITFAAVSGFSGTAHGVLVQVMDAYGQATTATYVPVVLETPITPSPATPEPVAPAPVAPAPVVPRPVVIVPARAVLSTATRHVVKSTAGAVPVVCSLTVGYPTRCDATLSAVVGGRPVVVGHSVRHTSATAVRAHSIAVPIALTALGRALAAQPGGFPVTATVVVSRRGVTGTVRTSRGSSIVAKSFVLPRPVFFQPGKADISRSDMRYLLGLRARLAGVGRVDCAGFTDWDNSARYNDQLGLERAVKVCAVLSQSRPVRTHVRTHGESSPHAPNTDARGRALNRRTEIRLNY